MSSREVFRAIQHAAGVHKASMGARNGYPSVIFPRLPTRVVERPTAVRAPKFLGLLQSPFNILTTFTLTRGLLYTRGQ